MVVKVRFIELYFSEFLAQIFSCSPGPKDPIKPKIPNKNENVIANFKLRNGLSRASFGLQSTLTFLALIYKPRP